MRNWFPILLVMFATFFWGTTFILVKASIALIPLNFFLMLRFTMATLLTAPLILYRQRILSGQLWIRGIILGTLLFASYYFQTVGLQFTTPAKAAFITGLSVVFIPIIAIIFLGKHISRVEAQAIVISLTGTLLMTLNFGSEITINFGDLIILLTAVSIALHILMTERFREETLVELLWIQFLTMSVWAFFLNLLSRDPQIVWYESPTIVFTLVVTVIFATIFAFAAQLYAQQKEVKSTYIGLLFALEPVFALLIDVLVGVIPTTITLVGMGLVLVSIILITLHSSDQGHEASEIPRHE